MKNESDEREEIEAPVPEIEGETMESIEANDITGVENGKEAPEAPEVPEETNKKVHMKVEADAPWSARMWEVFTTFWPLGLIAFGGPQVSLLLVECHGDTPCAYFLTIWNDRHTLRSCEIIW